MYKPVSSRGRFDAFPTSTLLSTSIALWSFSAGLSSPEPPFFSSAMFSPDFTLSSICSFPAVESEVFSSWRLGDGDLPCWPALRWAREGLGTDSFSLSALLSGLFWSRKSCSAKSSHTHQTKIIQHLRECTVHFVPHLRECTIHFVPNFTSSINNFDFQICLQ